MPDDAKVPMMEFYMSRKRVHVGQFSVDDLVIEDVFHNLCILPRFAGNTSRPYSVGEHSLLVYQMVDSAVGPIVEAGQMTPQEAGRVVMQALLHDGPEYITGDIPAPVKYEVPEVRDYEKNVLWPVFCEKFDLDEKMHPLVQDADWAALLVEAHSLHCSDDLTKWERYDKYWPAAVAWMEEFGQIAASEQPHPGMIMDALMTIYREMIDPEEGDQPALELVS